MGAGERPKIVQDKFPPECPEELIALMTECWDQDPDRRPTFEHVVETLDDFLPRPDLGSDDDEEFVESTWWRSPSHLVETLDQRMDLGSDGDDEEVGVDACVPTPS